jgi:hypothetical protein
MSTESAPYRIKLYDPNTAFEYAALHMDTDGHSLMARTGVGGAPWLTWTEQIEGMLGATVTITEWAENGRTITEMIDELPGQARPGMPETTLVARCSTEMLNEFVLAGFPLENVWGKIEEYCLAVKALSYYDLHFYIGGTPGGYNGFQEVMDTINARLAAGVTTNVHGANPIGTSLGIVFIDLMEEPEFAGGGLERGAHPCDPWTDPDVTNGGGILSKEIAHWYDWSGVHWSSNGHSLCARVVAEYLNDEVNIPLITASGFTMEKRNTDGSYSAVGGTVINAIRGQPTVLRARPLVGGEAADPSLHACLYRIDDLGDVENWVDAGYVSDPGSMAYYPSANGGTIRARCGKVTQDYTFNYTSGAHIPFYHVQRQLIGWDSYFGFQQDRHLPSDVRFLFEGEMGPTNITTTSGFVVGERVVSFTDATSGLTFTVPGGSVGPYLRTSCLTSFPYPPGSEPRTTYHLEFDSASAQLRTALSALNDLVAQCDLYIYGKFTNSTGVAPILPVKMHNAGNTQVMALDTSQTGWRAYRKTATQDGYTTAVGDRLTDSGPRIIKIYKWLSGIDSINYMQLKVQGRALDTTAIDVNPNFAAENLYLSLGGTGVDYLEIYALAAARGVAHDIDWFRQNNFILRGS